MRDGRRYRRLRQGACGGAEVRVVIDHLPTDAAESRLLQSLLRDKEIDAVLTLEHVELYTNVEGQIAQLANSADCFVIVWSPTAATLFDANHMIAAREAAQRVFQVGREKLIIWSTSDAAIPFELSDIPFVSSRDELVAELADRLRNIRMRAYVMHSLDPREFEPHQNKEIFLSYSSTDHDCAQQVVGRFEPDHSVWFAPRDLRGPGLYGNAILSAIMGCHHVVLLLTKSSVRSPHCIREIYLAVEERKPISVLCELATDQLPTDWRYPLAGIQLRDFDCRTASGADLRTILH